MKSLYQQNSLRSRRSTSAWEVVGSLIVAVLALPVLAALVFALSLALAALGSLVMLAVVNWGVVTLGTVFGFTVHTVGFWGAFKLCYVSMILTGIFGGTRVATRATKSS